MSHLQQLIDSNASWTAEIQKENPDFFIELANGQAPRYLWIGCADSRMPAVSALGLGPGDMFVHRNIANLVSEHDDSVQSIIEFGVGSLGVQDIIVCGHYGCGGVKAAAALTGAPENVVQQWVMPIKKTLDANIDEINVLDGERKHTRLCELNVAEQVDNVCKHPTVLQAWQNGRELRVHGLIYDISSGQLRDLEISRHS